LRLPPQPSRVCDDNPALGPFELTSFAFGEGLLEYFSPSLGSHAAQLRIEESFTGKVRKRLFEGRSPRIYRGIDPGLSASAADDILKRLKSIASTAMVPETPAFPHPRENRGLNVGFLDSAAVGGGHLAAPGLDPDQLGVIRGRVSEGALEKRKDSVERGAATMGHDSPRLREAEAP